jgi:hypothetical protein
VSLSRKDHTDAAPHVVPHPTDQAKQEEADEAERLQQEGFMGVLKEKARGMGFDNKRGACGKCGNVGHLTYQCRNMLGGGGGLDDEVSDDDLSSSSDEEGPLKAPAAEARPADGDVDGVRASKRARSDESSDEGAGAASSPDRKKARKDKSKKKVSRGWRLSCSSLFSIQTAGVSVAC